MRIWDDRYTRDLRCYELAWRLIHLGARTETICRMTGLTPSRVRTLHTEYAAQSANFAPRHRGSAPHRVDYFLSTSVRRAEAAAFAQWCAAKGWVPAGGGKASRPFVPTLLQAEEFCSTFELYRALLPDAHRSQLSFEHGVLLVTALASGHELRLTYCAQCEAAVIVEAAVVSESLCIVCRRSQRTAAQAQEDTASSATAVVETDSDPATSQQSLF